MSLGIIRPYTAPWVEVYYSTIDVDSGLTRFMACGHPPAAANATAEFKCVLMSLADTAKVSGTMFGVVIGVLVGLLLLLAVCACAAFAGADAWEARRRQPLEAVQPPQAPQARGEWR